MAGMDPLTTNLLDLLFELREHPVPLTIGGGFGLYLKRMRLDETRERTLFSQLPMPRATNDLDLFIRADVLCNLESMEAVGQPVWRRPPGRNGPEHHPQRFRRTDQHRHHASARAFAFPAGFPGSRLHRSTQGDFSGVTRPCLVLVYRGDVRPHLRSRPARRTAFSFERDLPTSCHVTRYNCGLV